MIKRMGDDILAKIKEFCENVDEVDFKEAISLAEENGVDVREVIDILMPLEPDCATLIAAIIQPVYFQDLVNDDYVKRRFGQEILSMLVNGKKLKNINYAENDRKSQLEILRKMFMVMAKDLRVILIGLAYRLLEMRKLEFKLNEEERVLFAKETLDLYVPIADRLGVYRLKTQLEDLSFRFCNPGDYEEIADQLLQIRDRFNVSIARIKESLEKFFATRGIDAHIHGRIKGIYSIYRKLKCKNLSSVNDLYDIFAMRIIVDPKYDESGNHAVDHLYGVLGMIHSEWKPLSKKFKDYIAVPKPNGYRSLHTVVLGLGPKDLNKPVEIQIRDGSMHRDAEYGVAAHWVYKRPDDNFGAQISWLKGLDKMREEEGEIELFKDRIFVLTPRGEVKDLPEGACPIDFAYSVHTDIGHHCVMVKVDDKVVPLDYELKNGEVVEIITKRDAGPKLQWLSVVKTGFAKNRIKTFFSSLNKENNVKEGRRLINNQLSRLEKPPLDSNYTILRDYLGKRLTVAEREGLVEEVGKGGKMVADVIRKIYPYEELMNDDIPAPVAGRNVENESTNASGAVDTIEDQILIGGESDLPVKIASCCKPKPGNDIVGYVTRGNRVTIHRNSCLLIDSLDGERLVYADWKHTNSKDKPKYVIGIKLIVASRVGLMRDITSVISNFDIYISDVMIKKLENGTHENYFLLELNDLDQFDLLMDKLESVRGVLNVSRDKKFRSNVK